ncbi:hypothetical protein [Salinarimonas ramus]|nr:hypothetical protein [Salinarimonas ramus]
MLDALPRPASPLSFGADIDAAHEVVLDTERPREERLDALLAWASRYQPCLFGRVAARGLRGIGIACCWLDDDDIARGDEHLRARLQEARRDWKRAALEGGPSGFLVMLASRRLVDCQPSDALVEICRRVADLYFVEFAPVACDVIYTEAVPLRTDRVRLYKGGANFFYPSAHGTQNHDRRVPGGLMMSINSAGHWASKMVASGEARDLADAVDQVMDLALRSIGNGGLGQDREAAERFGSCTWHNRGLAPLRPRRTPIGTLPRTVPQDHSQDFYSGIYHTDVLVPTHVTRAAHHDEAPQVWPNLEFSYITDAHRGPEHEDYGQVWGHVVPEEAMFSNPWPPLRPKPPEAVPAEDIVARACPHAA